MKFSDFGFKKFLNDALVEIGFQEPTSIQTKVIPYLKKHQAVIAQSHTGTGKTHAFLLPILNNLDYTMAKVQFLIITPTRELARQIYDNIKTLLEFQTQASMALYVGGDDLKKQQEALKTSQPMIVVGTPTRLRSLYEENYLQLTTANYVVLDECDMVFDLGFIDDVDFMIEKINRQAIISLFSATVSNAIKPFLLKYFSRAIFIENLDNKPSNKNIEHILVWTKDKENKAVLKIIKEAINPYLVVIFVNKKDQVPEVVSWLREFGIKNIGELHGDLDARTRTNMQKRIQNMEFKWIVASDVASRGIDIVGVSHVISIDLPKDLQYYIHRSGRTGRNNYLGQSYVLFNSTNQSQIDALKGMGIEFTNKKLVGSELVQINDSKKKKSFNPQAPAVIEENKIISRYHKKKVKPGYKKKRKAEIDKVKKEIRKNILKNQLLKSKRKIQKRREDLFE
ncbi:ATP-dependent RNA helicase [Spiroplasma clarkii]|uniref:DEAD/DEAH box helicase n=1 Tax=Spiroplasma clarkii TaxID=2139 RepID=UPI000B54C756|nr:DEAD/DEAH box helicase [Spiroplasma clarkii]ARU91667.1 ATP-dependent RNA helicase [Spiroplasma clarkii]